MNILVINSGSSTVKFQVIETTDATGDLRRQQKLARGLVDRIGAGASYRFEGLGRSTKAGSLPVGDHEEAVRSIIHWLQSNWPEQGLDAVGHRVVHGGDCFAESARIDEDVVATLETLCEIAPLHNPPAVSGIRAAQKILGPVIPMVAVFDTSFHHTIPEGAATYAIPYELSQKHGIRRYGFHGLAHQYDVMRYGEITGTPNGEINVVTLHLGNGCSACAVRGGISG